MIDLTKVVEAVIALAVALITTFLIPWIKAHTTEKQQERIEAVIETAVMCAEQLYGSGMGKEKLKAAQDYIASKGYTVDLAQIEAAVYALINADKPPEITVE